MGIWGVAEAWKEHAATGAKLMIDIEIRAAEGGEDAKLLIDTLAACYKRRASSFG